MKPVATVQQMRELDRVTIQDFGLDGLVLMETAARSVARRAWEMLGGQARGKTVRIWCGPGNNGGDGMAAARTLYNWGAQVQVVLPDQHLAPSKGDAARQLQLLTRLGVRPLLVREPRRLRRVGGTADLEIDALLGTGFRGELSEYFRESIAAINRTPGPVLAVDTPSGVDGDTGAVREAAVRADATVTFGLLKPGLLFPPGRDLAGDVQVADIGIPDFAVAAQRIRLFQVEEADVRKVLPHRAPSAHKGDVGCVYLLAGSPGLTGAAALAAESALRTGAGLVVVGCPKSLNPILEAKLTEPITQPLAETSSGGLASQAWPEVRQRLEWAEAVGIGPGMGRDPDTAALLGRVFTECSKPMVIDADGLNLLADHPDLLSKVPSGSVLTPHPGEFARLTGKSVGEILNARVELTREFARRRKVVVHLKGSPSLTARPDGIVVINAGGNAGMATGGSGDVLTGILATLLAQGVEAGQAAVAAAYIHGLAGDRAAEALGLQGMTAGDLIAFLPETIRALS